MPDTNPNCPDTADSFPDPHAEEVGDVLTPTDDWPQGTAFLTPGFTLGEHQLMSGRWDEEPFLYEWEHPREVAVDYLAILQDLGQAQRDEDHLTERRLRGEIAAAVRTFERMDAFHSAAALTALVDGLDNLEPSRNEPASTSRVPHVLPEVGRFTGPAPFYRRGRAYIQRLAEEFKQARHGLGVHEYSHTENDRMLRAVEASDNPQELQDFIAGAIRELQRQLDLLARTHTHDG